MPIFMQYHGLDGDVTSSGHGKWIEMLGPEAPDAFDATTGSAASQASGASDPEYKYVPVRRTADTEGGDGRDVLLGGAGGEAEGLSHGVSVLAWARVDGTGDVSGDGQPDVIVGAVGAGPHVKVFDAAATREGDFDGNDFLVWQRGGLPGAGVVGGGDLADWQSNYGASGTAMAGGVSVAAGDLTGEGSADAAIPHGVTVLAWSRVDGTSSRATGDDVVVDGRIVTAEDGTAAAAQHELGHALGFRHEHTRPEAEPSDSFSFAGATTGGGGGEDLLVAGRTGFDAVEPTFTGGVFVPTVDLDPSAVPEAGGAMVGLGDGSVRFLADGIDLF